MAATHQAAREGKSFQLCLLAYIYIYGLFVVACGLLCCSAHALELEGSVVAAHRPSYLMACGILVLQSGIKPVYPVLQGGLLTTGPPGKSP